MDGNTEPVIAVIGFPIAGNPSQFALERALEAVNLEWRVFSFEVSPQQLTTALDGLEALGVRGVLIDRTLAVTVGTWHDDVGRGPSDYTDCLYREKVDGPFVKYDSQRAWIKSQIIEHASSLHRDINRTIVGGEMPPMPFWRTGLIESTIEKFPRDPEKIADADLIVIEQADDGPVPLEIDHWPKGNESVLVIDASEGHPDLLEIEALGYKVISREKRRLGMLSECFRRWTSIDAPQEVIFDAIEEYLAV